VTECANFNATGHAIMRSVEPGEQWGWCLLDSRILEPAAEIAGG
jgi:hypothetical protein